MYVMSEQALYRKYRPVTFNDVLGQNHVVNALQGALKTDKIAHAYLFSGSRGTGKTSIARILAREIGCSDNDLYEIDAASNRGIDNVRELRESVRSMPFDSKHKVYIIDEVHMLTKEAFNALLKTLEEPPVHVIFILATTELEKLPETVVSRCQTFQFKKPSQKILKDLVTRIAKKEGFILQSASADLVALLGDGSFRDTQGILQKVIGASNNKNISAKEVESITGAPRSELINKLVLGIVEKDINSSLLSVRKASEDDIDMSIFLKLTLRSLRAILLLRFSGNNEMKDSIKEEFTEEEFTFLVDISIDKSANLSSQIIKELLIASDEMRFASISELPIELALVKIIGGEKK